MIEMQEYCIQLKKDMKKMNCPVNVMLFYTRNTCSEGKKFLIVFLCKKIVFIRKKKHQEK